MSALWRLAFKRITNNLNFYRIAGQAFGLAGLATIVTAPYFYYLLLHVAREKIQSITAPYQFLGAQLVLLFIVCFFSAVAGFSLGPRYKMPGFGRLRQYLHDLPFVAAVGLVLMIASYGFFDRYFYHISPASYPLEFLFIAAIPLKGAFAEEIILRFGLVTIGVGFCRNRAAGILLVAVFATLLSLKYLGFAGIGMSFSYIFIMQLLLTFVINCILGILFVTRGLLYAMTVKFIIGWKGLLVAVSV